MPVVSTAALRCCEPWRRLVFSTLHKLPGLLIIGEASDGQQAAENAEALRPARNLDGYSPSKAEGKRSLSFGKTPADVKAWLLYHGYRDASGEANGVSSLDESDWANAPVHRLTLATRPSSLEEVGQ